MRNLEIKNYRIFITSNSFMSFAFGLLRPFYVIFIEKLGGIEILGLGMGIMMIFYSLSGYFAGKYSDIFGRKNFLVGSGVILSIVIFSYTLISSVLQLIILQIIDGIAGSVYQTMEMSFLGDITKRESRGKYIGLYHTLLGMASGIAMIIAGFIVAKIGLKIIFYLTASLTFVSSLILLGIKE